MVKQTGGNVEHVVTMRDVAKAAGMSVKTVSNVVNDYEFVSQATRDKVNKAIAELGYTLNMSARNLRKGQTGIIGLAIPDLQMPYFAQLSSLIIAEAKKVGLRVIVEPTQYSREGELEALHGTQQTMLDGLIYSPLELGQDDVDQLNVDYPLVLIGERIFTDAVDHIATENVEGAKRATQYLLKTGCRHVAVVGVHPGEKVGSAALRYRGYLEALEEFGVDFDDRLVAASIMWHRSDGVRAMNALLDSGVDVDGVVALNDMLASGVMHAIQMRGLSIPKELDEAAEIDGASDFQIFTRIMLPAIRPILIVIFLFSFTGAWNDFLWPTLVFNDINKMPVTAGLQLLSNQMGQYNQMGSLMAATCMAILPTLLLFLFAQKYFLQSLNITSGLKG